MDDHESTTSRLAEDTTEVSGHPVNHFGSIHISGHAEVQLGDYYEANRDVFNTGTPEQRTAILNLLYYDALDLKREQLGADDFGPASFAWVNVKDTKFYTWLETGTTPFWIQGKPASGKSTLMKYLSESTTTYDALRRRGGEWKILQFFFDYRSGKNIANHVLGLLKLFIRQFVKQVPEFAERLTDEHTRRKIAGEDTIAHLDVLAHLVRSSNFKICAFIDGLDEYDGDDWELCSKLEALRDRTGMKLCLASRPEAAFVEHYAEVPTLVMQEHNLASINIYIRSKIAKFRSVHPFQNHLFPDTLQTAIAEKSQGVILWARLVIDEMIKSCDSVTKPEDLTVYLGMLPSEMEPLYERILGRAEPDRQQEASILLMLVDEDTRSTPSNVILPAWKYIETSCLAPGALPQNSDHDACLSRAKALLSGLIETVEVSAEHGYSRRTVRLLHKSLSTYLRRSSWLILRLPEPIKQRYSNDVWNRLTHQVLSQASDESAVDIEPLISDYKRGLNEASKPYEGRPIVNHKQDDLAPRYSHLQSGRLPGSIRDRHEDKAIEQFELLIKARPWSPLSELLLNCIERVSRIDHLKIAETLLFVHLIRCGWCEINTDYLVGNNLLLLYSESLMAWLVAMNHGHYKLALMYLQADKTRFSHDTLDAMFEMLDRSAAENGPEDYKPQELEALEKLIMYFTQRSITTDSRHLCLLRPHLDYASTLELFISQRPSTIRTSFIHHACCPYQHVDVGLLHHLAYLCPTCNIAPNGYGGLLGHVKSPAYSNGKHLFHRTLCMSEEAKRKSIRTFIRLAEVDVQPDVTGGPNNLISYAKSQRRKLKLKVWSKSTDREKLLLFLQDAIRALEEYEKNGNKWGDLDRLKAVYDYCYD